MWSVLGGAAQDVVDVVGEEKYPLHFPDGAPTGGEVTGEPLGRYWCAIKVGKNVAKPR